MTMNYVSGKSVVINAARNLLGQGVPIIAAFYCIPQLIAVLGAERFGFLTLMWVAVGYLSIFDLGLGQALTKLVADKIGRNEQDSIAPLFWTAIWLMCGLGLAGMVIVEITVPLLANKVFNLPDALKQEAYSALQVIAISLPLVIVSTGTRGVLEAYLRFDLINWIRIPLGIFTFVAPLLVARYVSNELSAIAWVLVVGRLIFLFSTIWLCLKVTPALRKLSKMHRVLLKPLFGFGGWMTLSNLIGPMMVYLDRFVIGSVITMTAVAYYVTPYEVITKLWILPNALTGVLFSAFAINLVNHPERTAKLYGRAIDGIFLLMLPVTMIMIAFASDGLTLWLGADFASHAVSIFQILAIGVLINSCAQVPVTLIKSAGRPDIPALLYLVELPLYLFGLWYTLKIWGVIGAAIIWVLRIMFDNVVLLVAYSRIFPNAKPVMWRGIAISTLPVAFLYTEILLTGWYEKMVIAIAAIGLFLYAIFWFAVRWHGKLPEERNA